MYACEPPVLPPCQANCFPSTPVLETQPIAYESVPPMAAVPR